MDSLSQLALGAAVGIGVMGRRTALWKAAAWGAACGTLPDLDALIDHGDPVLNMTLHRGNSHALFWLTLISPVIGWSAAKLHGELDRWRRWVLAIWAALITHPLLDAMTVYGTQLLRPFNPEPLGLGSIFIIDPLYTLPLLVGVVAALRLAPERGLRWNAAGLLLSCAYLAWSAAAQQHVSVVARQLLQAQGVNTQQMLVTPTPFNTVLWRVLAVDGDHYHETFYSLLDDKRPLQVDSFPRGLALQDAAGTNNSLQRIARFSHGFYRLAERDGRLLIADLRMGQEPFYIFDFAIAHRSSGTWLEHASQAAGQRADLGPALRWLSRRMWGEALPPPR